MLPQKINILLAEDDQGDCLLFEQVLKELPISANLTIVENGELLLEAISKEENKMPDVLFLDLNMPRKSGFSSLSDIKRSIKLQDIPVIILTTSSQQRTIDNTFRDAAHYYICKPNDFLELKKVIYEALMIITKKDKSMPNKKNFVLTGADVVIPDSKESK